LRKAIEENDPGRGEGKHARVYLQGPNTELRLVLEIALNGEVAQVGVEIHFLGNGDDPLIAVLVVRELEGRNAHNWRAVHEQLFYFFGA
jgi:hypothetical protein